MFQIIFVLYLNSLQLYLWVYFESLRHRVGWVVTLHDLSRKENRRSGAKFRIFAVGFHKVLVNKTRTFLDLWEGLIWQIFPPPNIFCELKGMLSQKGQVTRPPDTIWLPDDSK